MIKSLKKVFSDLEWELRLHDPEEWKTLSNYFQKRQGFSGCVQRCHPYQASGDQRKKDLPRDCGEGTVEFIKPRPFEAYVYDLKNPGILMIIGSYNKLLAYLAGKKVIDVAESVDSSAKQLNPLRGKR